MPIRSRHIAREMGTALAVLAVYVLVLLAPLHQAAGLQRDLSQLGYESPWSLSVCASVGETGDPDTPSPIKCPLTNAGKSETAGLLPPAGPVIHGLPEIGPLDYPAAAPHFAGAHADLPGRPRGPPAAA